MINRYRQGYLAELELVKLLKRSPQYHSVLRSAGSRSPFDVVAIGASEILLCQVKTGGQGRYASEQRALEQLQVPGNVQKEIWIYRDREWQIVQVP